MNLLDVPTDILLYILGKRIDIRNISKICLVNKQLNQICNDNLFWKMQTDRFFTVELTDEELQLSKNIDYRDIYLTHVHTAPLFSDLFNFIEGKVFSLPNRCHHSDLTITRQCCKMQHLCCDHVISHIDLHNSPTPIEQIKPHFNGLTKISIINHGNRMLLSTKSILDNNSQNIVIIYPVWESTSRYTPSKQDVFVNTIISLIAQNISQLELLTSLKIKEYHRTYVPTIYFRDAPGNLRHLSINGFDCSHIKYKSTFFKNITKLTLHYPEEDDYEYLDKNLRNSNIEVLKINNWESVEFRDMSRPQPDLLMYLSNMLVDTILEMPKIQKLILIRDNYRPTDQLDVQINIRIAACSKLIHNRLTAKNIEVNEIVKFEEDESSDDDSCNDDSSNDDSSNDDSIEEEESINDESSDGE